MIRNGLTRLFKGFKGAPPERAPAPTLGQLGATGSARLTPQTAQWQGGKILAYRTDEVRIEDLDRLRQDPVVKAALLMKKLPILRANLAFVSDDADHAAFCQRALEPVLRDLLWGLLSALDFGFAVLEEVWQSECLTVTDSQANAPSAQRIRYPHAWTIKQWAALDPSFSWLLVYPDGSLAGVRQYLAGAPEIDAAKLVHFAFESEFNEVYGNPAIKACLPFWELKVQALQDSGLYYNTYAVPSRLGFAPPGDLETGIDSQGAAQKMSNLDLMLEFLKAMQSSHSAAFSSETYPPDLGGGRKWAVEQFAVSPAVKYEDIISFYDDQMREALGVPKLAQGVGQTGSYNLGQAQIDLFLDNEEALAAQIESAINRQHLPRLVRYNFGRQAPPVRLKLKVNRAYESQMLSALIENLAKGEPLLSADGSALLPDYKKLLEEAGLPTQVVEREQYEALFKADSDDPDHAPPRQSAPSQAQADQEEEDPMNQETA